MFTIVKKTNLHRQQKNLIVYKYKSYLRQINKMAFLTLVSGVRHIGSQVPDKGSQVVKRKDPGSRVPPVGPASLVPGEGFQVPRPTYRSRVRVQHFPYANLFYVIKQLISLTNQQQPGNFVKSDHSFLPTLQVI